MAAVQLRDAAAVDVAALTRHARTKLPGYAVPRQLSVVDQFPRTSSGKIDRKQLTEKFLEPDDT